MDEVSDDKYDKNFNLLQHYLRRKITKKFNSLKIKILTVL